MAFNFRPDDEQTRVKLLFSMPGQGGTNQARMFIDDHDPKSIPDVSLLVIDADGPLLKDRLVLKVPTWKRADPNDKDPEARLREWQKGDQLSVIQARRSAAAGKLFGAGGNPEEGEEIVTASMPEIVTALEGNDLIVNWGAGGGGIGTPAMRLVAKKAKELQIPVISILITPFAWQGEKLAIADKLCVDLREFGPVLVVRNKDFPEAEGETIQELYRRIYVECRGLQETLTEITQVPGTSNNVDLNDVLAAAKRGKDLVISKYTVKEGEQVNIQAAVTTLLDPPGQAKEIKAKALLFCWKGVWTNRENDAIYKGVQRGTNFPTNGFIKPQDNDNSEEKSVSVMCFGSFTEEKATSKMMPPAPDAVVAETARENAREVIEVRELPAAAAASSVAVQVKEPTAAGRARADNDRRKEAARTMEAKYGKEKVPGRSTVTGRTALCTLPARLINAWNSAREDEQEKLYPDFEFYGAAKPDIGTRITSNHPDVAPERLPEPTEVEASGGKLSSVLAKVRTPIASTKQAGSAVKEWAKERFNRPANCDH